jgi:hypothetical protein
MYNSASIHFVVISLYINRSIIDNPTFANANVSELQIKYCFAFAINIMSIWTTSYKTIRFDIIYDNLCSVLYTVYNFIGCIFRNSARKRGCECILGYITTDFNLHYCLYYHHLGHHYFLLSVYRYVYLYYVCIYDSFKLAQQNRCLLILLNCTPCSSSSWFWFLL